MSARAKTTPRHQPEPLVCPCCRRPLAPYLTEAETAHLVGRSSRTLRNLRVRGDGPRFIQTEPGGTVMYDLADVVAWMGAHKKYSTSDAAEDRAATAAH